MKPKAIFDFTTHLPAKMPPKWDLSLYMQRIAPGKIKPSKPVTCDPKHASPANESETKTLTPSPPLST